MTARTFVVLGCDVRRHITGCHERYEVRIKDPESAEARARIEAETAGWVRERHGTGPDARILDCCPSCSAARFAGVVGPRDAAEIEALPADPAVWRRSRCLLAAPRQDHPTSALLLVI
jgi:hypothetical protein